MNRKGAAGMVAAIIGAVIVLVMLANVFIPQVKSVTQSSSYSDSLVRNTAPSAEDDTLSRATAGYDLVTDSLSISGLTLNANYTVDYSTGVVSFNATTANGTYTAAYEYYQTGYVNNTSERVLLAFLVFAGIIGAVVLVFKSFNLMD